MNYLITAAGKGSRFLKKGIKPPKPLIKVLGNELLIWSLFSFNFKSDDRLFIVTQDKHNVKKILEKKIKSIFPNIDIFWLELQEILKGQLITAIEAINYFNIKGALTIHNCDTFHKFENDEINSLLSDDELFGVIPCFDTIGENWSFAKTSKDDPSLAIEVKEKVRISNNCSVGTYIFKDCKDLLNLSNKYFDDIRDTNKYNEFFIAPIYQYAIDNNLKVKITVAKKVKVFGTPDELVSNFKISFQELLGENAWDANQIKTLIVDIDQTICSKEPMDDYSEAKPIKNICDALKKANEDGVYIILFTSRNMRTFKGSLGLINKLTAPNLINWLKDNKIPYDEIYFGKPWGNSVSYIDDKNMTIDNFTKYYLN